MRRRRFPIVRAAALVGLAVLGCTNSGDNRITGISATGQVVGFLYVDANGSRRIDAGDDSLPGVAVRLALKGRQDTGLVRTSGATGFYRFRDVPVGVYTLTVDTASFADTLQVVKVDSASFTVGASDTVLVNALVGRPSMTVREARAPSAVGRRVFVEGVALAASNTFADSTSAIADTSGTIRVVRPRAFYAAGDSVRLLATVGERNNEPALDDPTVIALGSGTPPAAPVLTAAQAATAAGGARDAALVIVDSVTIVDTSRTANSYLLTANDGSGGVVVQLDFTADAAFQPASLPGSFVPGSRFDVTGLLLPSGSGTWRLRPRSASDLTLIPLPVSSIREARNDPAGTVVSVVGVALNGSGTFADSSVFLADTSGAIRLVGLRAAVSAADSVRIRGTVASRDGEPVLVNGTATALGVGLYPVAPTLSTAQAATAAGGARDAALVGVKGATISDTSRTTNSYLLTVNDGSGAVVVQLDFRADAAFQPASLPGSFIPGNKLDLVGVLAPTGTGSWRLRPRSSADVTVVPLPVISIGAARQADSGTLVSVVGVALNGSNTFADSSVFLADTSGAIRMIQLRTSISAGDSVRVRATTSRRDGEPTLVGGYGTQLGFGFYPAATTLTTATAATANGGVQDAELVKVPGAIVSDTARTATSYLLTVNDSSGPLTVQLDFNADAAFRPTSLPGVYVPGNKFDLLGILAPTGTGTWRLRPRSAADLTQVPLPVISIAAARQLAPGIMVNVVGVALNSLSTFSDTTVSLVDTSGAILLTRLRSNVSAGDSVKVRAKTSTRNGQPTLDAGTTTALGGGLFPQAAVLTTAQAAGADGGTRDAQLVVVDSAAVTDTASTLTGFKLTVTDGSGNLTVFMDPKAGFSLPGPLVPGNSFRFVGILVATGTGSWMLKPRSTSDILQY